MFGRGNGSISGGVRFRQPETQAPATTAAAAQEQESAERPGISGRRPAGMRSS